MKHSFLNKLSNRKHRFLLMTMAPFLMLLLTACPPKEYIRQDLNDLLNNKMDFLEFKRVYFDNLNFLLPKCFDKRTYSNITYKDDQCFYQNDELNLYFTCEHFYADEAESYQFMREDSVSQLDAIHDMYVAKRIATLKKNKLSIKKEIHEKSELEGVLQTISGGSGYGEQNTYFIASVIFGDEYFVFQFIGRQGNMDYLEDDFQKIIESVRF